jgi:hypothetical protein
MRHAAAPVGSSGPQVVGVVPDDGCVRGDGVVERAEALVGVGLIHSKSPKKKFVVLDATVRTALFAKSTTNKLPPVT